MFLVSSDVAGYKLASNAADLTKIQILFLEHIALKIHEQINGKTNSSNELSISSDDSYEDMRDKLDVMKGYMCP